MNCSNTMQARSSACASKFGRSCSSELEGLPRRKLAPESLLRSPYETPPRSIADAAARGAAETGQPTRQSAFEHGSAHALRRARRYLARQPARRLHGQELWGRHDDQREDRSEERRVGKEGRS